MGAKENAGLLFLFLIQSCTSTTDRLTPTGPDMPTAGGRDPLTQPVDPSLIAPLETVSVTGPALVTPGLPEQTEPVAATEASCVLTTTAERQMAHEAFLRLYPVLRDRYVTAEGAGGFLRVRVDDGELENKTVSEGIGYWMILSVHAHDRATFDGLWNYARSHLNQHSLMHWRIGADNKPDTEPPEGDSASDADLDIAYALYAADQTWGGYHEPFFEMTEAIMTHEVEPETYILKPGEWGGSDVTSPAYFRPWYYDIFAKATGDVRWLRVAEASRNMIEAIMAQTPAGDTGLMPNWAAADGSPGYLMGDDSFTYGWDASRVPIWLMIYLQYTHPDSAEPLYIQLMKSLNRTFESYGPGNVPAGINLLGTPQVPYSDMTFSAGQEATAIVSDDEDYRKQMFEKLSDAPPDRYFGDSLRMLTLLGTSGQMVK